MFILPIPSEVTAKALEQMASFIRNPNPDTIDTLEKYLDSKTDEELKLITQHQGTLWSITEHARRRKARAAAATK